MIGFTVKKVVQGGKAEYIVDDNKDLPLNRRHLSLLLNKCMHVHVYEIAIMHENWDRNSHHKIAYFGINGTFMFSE